MSSRYTDEVLLQDLTAACARFDPVPGEVRQQAVGAFAFRTTMADLAALVYDSDAQPLVGIRGRAARQLTFRGATLSLDVEVIGDGPFRLLGQLAPPATHLVEVCHGAGITSAVADELGQFRCDDVPPGAASIRCVGGDGVPIAETAWVTL